MNELIRTINSREIAKMVGREHNEVLKDTRKIMEHLAKGKNPLSDYFIESTYVDTNKRERPCFEFTKKGCELYSTRMTGAKGTQFAVEYIERFNEMEEQLTTPQLPMSNTELLLETALKHERDFSVVYERLDKLETETTVTSSQRRKIQGLVHSTVIRVLGGKKSNAYRDKSINHAAFSNCYRQLKAVFDVSSYSDIPKIRYEEVMSLIPKWQPDLELQARIDTANGNSNIFKEH